MRGLAPSRHSLPLAGTAIELLLILAALICCGSMLPSSSAWPIKTASHLVQFTFPHEIFTQTLTVARLLLAANTTPRELSGTTHSASSPALNYKTSTRDQSVGHWLPRNRSKIQTWIGLQSDTARHTHNCTLSVALQNFHQTIRQDPVLSQLADSMFIEVPGKPPYNVDPPGHRDLKDLDHFLVLLDTVFRQGPQWYDRNQPSTAWALIGAPIYALLDWPIGTLSGYQFFLSEKVNVALKEVLQHWGRFLKSPASAACLDGWLSSDAKRIIAEAGNVGRTNYTFEELFHLPDVAAPHLGFQSWDHFFVRAFQDSRRLVASTDHDSVITNACESAPLQVKYNVSSFDTFYLKGQLYSLENMLNGNSFASNFAGGTVYQAYLSALRYHRWHAPVSGKVVKIEIVPGTYFSENYLQGLARNAQDPGIAMPGSSQAYLSSVAARGIVYIQAKNPKIGLMAVAFIGMGEVSSCGFTIEEGNEIVKGDEIGMFHYGGSTHALVFRPGLKLGFLPTLPQDGVFATHSEHNQMVKSALAVVQ